MSSPNPSVTPVVLSYLLLRKAVGYLGFALPFVLYVGGRLFCVDLQESISDYYYTPMRNVFVGTLCAIGVFMLSYRGYDKADRTAGTLACVFAIAIALFPRTPHGEHPRNLETWIGYAHYFFAVGFFLTVSYFSYFLFTKTNLGIKPLPDGKRVCNFVYRSCGVVMFGAIILIALLKFFGHRYILSLGWTDYVFCLETLLVVAFGISWLTKGEALRASLAAPLTRVLAKLVP
jgi:hypothetical protein